MDSQSSDTLYAAGRQAVEQHLGFKLHDAPVHVVVHKEVARTEAGQVALLSLVNMLARVHNVVTIDTAEDVELVVQPMFGVSDGSLVDSTIKLCLEANPSCRVWPSNRPVPGSTTIGIGPVQRRCHWHVGANRALATVRTTPVQDDSWSHPGTVWGAALAACLVASAALRSAHGLATTSTRMSAWNWAEGERAEPGPDAAFPLERSSKLLVGAGSVAGSLGHWLHYLGAAGSWTVIDDDAVTDGNLIKGLNLRGCDLGRGKAELLAGQLPRSTWERCWYDKSNLAREQFDLVLCLANERDVRAALSLRAPALILHATTGECWDVRLHRHIRNRDDCLACRTQDWRQAVLACSEVRIESDKGHRADTALPFAAGLAGLMLASALSRLESGELELDECNGWGVAFEGARQLSLRSKFRCRAGCPSSSFATPPS